MRISDWSSDVCSSDLSLVENAVQDALAGSNEAIDQAREMLAGAGEQALRDALAEVRGPLDDAMGALGPALDALPEEFPELPVDLTASDCLSVNALPAALHRPLAGAGNAPGTAGPALGAELASASCRDSVWQ